MNRDERRLYQVNKLSYNLVMVFILLNTAYAIFSLQNMMADVSIGFFVMITIAITMVAFLAAVKLQTYSKTWGYVTIVIGGIQFLRYILSPSEIEGNMKMYLTILILTSIVFVIAGGITALVRTNKRAHYLKHDYKGNEVIH